MAERGTVIAQETHYLHLEECDVKVELGDDGEVWTHFVIGGDPKVTLGVRELAEIVAFVEIHGQVTVLERDV